MTPTKPIGLRFLLHFHELLRPDPPLDRVVPHRRAQVLGDGDDLAAGVVQVAQRLADLIAGLAHAEDQVRLGHQAVVAGLGDDVQRPLVAEPGPDPAEDPRHRLDVVREHLGPGREDLGQLLRDGVEVRREHLDPGARVELVDLADRLGVQPGAAVLQVVAGDAGHGRVAQSHLGPDRLGDAARLVAVQRLRLAGVDLAEVTPPGALVATDQEGGLAVLPALEDVRAAGLLAHRVQLLGLHERLQRLVLRAHLGARLDPLGFALDRGLRVAHLEPE